jgi:uncharacterized protein
VFFVIKTFRGLSLLDKLEQLKNILKSYSSAVVAYSGGVDSTFLAVITHQVLGEKSLAVTAVSPTYPEDQLIEAKEIATQYGFSHQVIHTKEFDEPDFIANPPNRCYYCKLALFKQIRQLADEKGFKEVLDGANVDDLSDFRPGHRATKELRVRSPLQEAGMTKADIREASRALSLPTWNKPACACLASRIPYGISITPEALQRIDQAEKYLFSLGFVEIRVRDHYPVARIEVGKSQLDLAWQQRDSIAVKLHEFGFPFVSLDLDGFRSGSMNVTIK